MNVKKAMEADQLRETIKNLKLELQTKVGDLTNNIERITSNLKFSRDANTNLKNDYDLLLEKFDKHMKATNNLN